MAMTRTGSIGSCVPPALTTTLRPGQVAVASQGLAQAAEKFGRFKQPTLASQAGRQSAARGAGDYAAHRAQRLDIALSGGVVVHVGVHSGGDDERRLGCQYGRGECVVREAVGYLGDGVGGRGRDNDGVGALGDCHMVDAQLGLGVEDIGYDGAMRDALECEGREELAGVGRHDDIDERARLRELAGEVDGFVTGDAAGYAERDVAMCQRVGHYFTPILTFPRQEGRDLLRCLCQPIEGEGLWFASR